MIVLPGMYLSNGCQVVSCLIESNIMGGFYMVAKQVFRSSGI